MDISGRFLSEESEEKDAAKEMEATFSEGSEGIEEIPVRQPKVFSSPFG